MNTTATCNKTANSYKTERKCKYWKMHNINNTKLNITKNQQIDEEYIQVGKTAMYRKRITNKIIRIVEPQVGERDAIVDRYTRPPMVTLYLLRWLKPSQILTLIAHMYITDAVFEYLK